MSLNKLLNFKGVLKVVFSFNLIWNAFALNAQHQVCLGEDITICQGDNLTIDLCTNQSADTNVVFLGNINGVNLTDDQFSQVIDIGFNFQFYGNNFTQCLISSNGYITFNTGNAGGFSPWAINAAVPSPNTPLNAVMGPWHDYNPNNGGFIGYTTRGVAPNRQFVVVYKEVFMFGDPTEGCSGIVLHEGSNKIEVFLDEKPIVPGWNNGASIQAIQNGDGTIAHPVPGRNFPTQWAATLDGKAWVPNGSNNYTVHNIPYRGYVIGNSQLIWMNTQGNQLTPTGQNLVVTPTAPAGTNQIGYYVNYSSCAVNAMLTSDTTWVTINNISVTVDGEDDFCSAGDGTATAIVAGGIPPFSYVWNDPDGQTTQTASGLLEGNYTVTVTDSLGCSASGNVFIGDTPIDLIMSYTPVTCPDGNDGTASVEINPIPGSATYLWSDANGQTSSTATGLEVGTYTVTVTTDIGCQNTAEIDVLPLPEMIVGLVASSDVTCNSGNDGQASIEVTQGTAPYTYLWETSQETNPSANELVAGVNVVTVTDANGCTTSFEVTLDEPNPLEIAFISEDIVICREDSTLLTAIGQGGSSDYTFTWFENGALYGTGDSIIAFPSNDGANFCVQLSELCGSPIAEACMTISYPEDIFPMLSADTLGTCIPTPINFQNTTESDDVVFTVWSYGDGNTDTIVGKGPAFNEYQASGSYDVTMDIYSGLGCKFSYTYENLIFAYRFPEGGMYFNPTPATIFDPIVQGVSQATPDVVSYEWFAPAAIPDYSIEKNPIFRYPPDEFIHDVMLVITTANECRDTVYGVVRVINDVQFFAPNTFTPDGDEMNESWRVFIEGIDLLSFNMKVFNRWGELVFESNDPEFQWDGTYKGKKAPNGTYVWKAEFRSRENDNKYSQNGYVTIIR